MTAVSFGGETAGSLAVSPVNAPGDHAACDAVFARMKKRAEAAEAKVAALRTVLLEGGQDDTTARRRAIGIVGTGEESGDG